MVAAFKPQGWKESSAQLDKRVSVFGPSAITAGYTNDLGERELVVEKRPAAILPAGGGEIDAGGGRQPGDRVVIVMRFERALQRINTSWTLRNDRTGRVYNITQVDDPEMHDRWIYILCEYGKESDDDQCGE